MADATLYKPGTGGTTPAQPVLPDDVTTNQFNTPYSGPVRQLAGTAVRLNSWSSGIGSSISTSRDLLYKNPSRSIY